MKILVIDYLSYVGHKRFNKIHFDAINRCGDELAFVGRYGQFENIPEANVVLTIPEWFYKSRFFPSVSYRLQMILCLWWIRFKVAPSQYDLILFPTYEVLTYLFSPFKGRQVAINHQNVGLLSNFVKRWATKILPSSIIHIALDKMTSNKLKEILPKCQVFYVPHGFEEPSSNIKRPKWVTADSFFFCPVNRNFDLNVLKSVITNSELKVFLKDYNVDFVLRDIDGLNYPERFVKLSANTPQQEYDYLIQNAKAVILPYDKYFVYRTSGIFFECIATDTPVIVPRMDSFIQYEDFNVWFYSNIEELIDNIKDCYFTKERKVVEKECFSPYNYWISVLNFCKELL